MESETGRERGSRCEDTRPCETQKIHTEQAEILLKTLLFSPIMIINTYDYTSSHSPLTYQREAFPVVSQAGLYFGVGTLGCAGIEAHYRHNMYIFRHAK